MWENKNEFIQDQSAALVKKIKRPGSRNVLSFCVTFAYSAFSIISLDTV